MRLLANQANLSGKLAPNLKSNKGGLSKMAQTVTVSDFSHAIS
jgi:hypothetical protein